MDDVSMFFKTNKDPSNIVEGLSKLRDSKHRSTAAPKSNNLQPGTQSVSLDPHQPVSPPKASHLPVKRGSNISRSFPRVRDSDHKFDSKNKSILNGDLIVNDKSLTDSVKESDKNFETNKDKTAARQKDKQVSQNVEETPQDEAIIKSLWTSPPRASLCPQTTGVLEKLQEFSFKFSTAKMDAEKHNITTDLREKFSEMDIGKGSASVCSTERMIKLDSHTNEAYVGERETPPPDGQAFNGYSSAQNVQNSALLRDGLSSVSDSGARPKLYDSGFNSVTDSQLRDSSLSRQRDLSNLESKSAVRARSFMSTGSEGHSIELRNKESDRSSLAQNIPKSSSAAAGSHVGFVPGHHVPDGTEYSHQSDYSHMDHKGMSRDDLEGTADIGLADSRGFDAIKGSRSNISAQEMERSLRRQIQYERDKEQRLESFVPHEGNVSERNVSLSQIGQSKPPLNLQPSQSLSPFVKSSRPNVVKQNGVGDGIYEMNDEHKTVETQTAADRHESWTQTSVVLRQSVGLQPDNVIDDQLQTDDNLLETERVSNISSVSQGKAKHSVLPSTVKDAEKPRLLSKDSLINTEFAQGYLKRDFSREVMDRIYSSCDITSLNQHYTDTKVHNLNGRESIESRNNWTTLRPNETIESVYDESRLNEIAQRGLDLTHPSFYHRPPSACSTPFHGSRDFQTTLTPSTMHTLPSTGYRSMVSSDTDHVTGKGTCI